MSALTVEISPRALRDLKHLSSHDAAVILDDIETLRALPWPGPPKVKPLKGTPYVRLRTSHFRSIIVREGQQAVVLRVVARRDLDRVLKGL